MADLLDEVESDYRAEQLRAAAMRYAWLVAVALIAVLLAAGGWEYWQARQQRARMAAAALYLDTAKAQDALVAGDTPGHLASASQLAGFAATAPGGYRALAELRQAAALAGAGKLADAEAVWNSVSIDPTVDPLLRQLASLLWVQRGLDSADPNALRTRLVSLTAPDSAFRSLAQEIEALLDLRLGQTDAARTVLRRISADPAAPDGVRGRAGALLTRLGG